VPISGYKSLQMQQQQQHSCNLYCFQSLSRLSGYANYHQIGESTGDEECGKEG
jgi:hypothetical protein